MRWAHWLLALVGIAQFGLIAYLHPTDYVSVDMAYLVMALFVLAAVAAWYCSCSWCGDDGCGCCGDDCTCGDCGDCRPHGHEGQGGGHGHDGGHEGHHH